MATSLKQAIAEVEGPQFDAIVGYSIPARRSAPVDPDVEEAFRSFDYRQFGRIARRLSARYRCDQSEAEDAVHDALVHLYEKRSDLYRKNPESWLGLLHRIAQHRLLEIKLRQERTESIEGLVEQKGDTALTDARSCVPPALIVDEDAKFRVAPSGGEPWDPSRIIGALQRFRDYHGRPPKSRECKAINGLPCPTTIHRHFETFSDAILAAGMTPDGLGAHRSRWSPTAAARACRSFRQRNGYWPGWADIKRNPGELPGTSAMIRYFGSTRPGEVQLGAEAILASRERSPSRRATSSCRKLGS